MHKEKWLMRRPGTKSQRKALSVLRQVIDNWPYQSFSCRLIWTTSYKSLQYISNKLHGRRKNMWPITLNGEIQFRVNSVDLLQLMQIRRNTTFIPSWCVILNCLRYRRFVIRVCMLLHAASFDEQFRFFFVAAILRCASPSGIELKTIAELYSVPSCTIPSCL